MDAKHFLRYVIADTLEDMATVEPRTDSLPARALMLGTAMVESDLKYLQQIRGPAVGFYQMEPFTHDDLWKTFLPSYPELARFARSCSLSLSPDATEMRWNLRYATVMARLRYWRAVERLPELNARGLAGYHERHYNTRLGALGRTPELEAEPIFDRAIVMVEIA